MVTIATQNLYQKSLQNNSSFLSLDEIVENIKNENYKELENISNTKAAFQQALKDQPYTKLSNLMSLIDAKLAYTKDKRDIATLKDIKHIINNKLFDLSSNKSLPQLKNVLSELKNIIKDTQKSSFPSKKELLTNLNRTKKEIEKLIDDISKQIKNSSQNSINKQTLKAKNSTDNTQETNLSQTKPQVAQRELFKNTTYRLTTTKTATKDTHQTFQKDTNKQISSKPNHTQPYADKHIQTTKLIREKLPDITLNLKKAFKLLDKQILPKNSTSDMPINEAKELKTKLTDLLNDIQNITQDEQVATKNIKKDIIQALKEHINTNQTKSINIATKQHVIKIISNISKQINEIKDIVGSDLTSKDIAKSLENFTKDINSIDLKKNITNSGLFLESKLKDVNILGKDIQDDLKATLYKLKASPTNSQNSHLQSVVDKTITDIQTLQLNSIINSNITMYIPFEWDSLKNGTMSFYGSKTKKSFSCQIDLELENHGKVDIMMILDDNSNVSMSFDIEDREFQKTIKKHIGELKDALSSININANIFFSRKKSSNSYQTQETTLDMGMDLKI